MNKIFLLTDYKNNFGSRHDSIPYRSGMDKKKLVEIFAKYGYDVEYLPLSEAWCNKDKLKGNLILYTSQEDIDYHYKNYIEDIIYALELFGCRVIPSFEYLKANNNKVFMEMMCDHKKLRSNDTLKTFNFGTLEEALKCMNKFQFPIILKGATGASAENVYLAKNKKDLIYKLKKISSTQKLTKDIKDSLRAIKYKGYSKESKYRKKFIIQSFIPNLKNDWKIYIFGEKIFVFYRPVFKHREFKASGGGYNNYYYGKEAFIPDGLFDFAYDIFKKLNVPCASLDIALADNFFLLLEFQVIYFGTAGILKKYSSEYFFKDNNKWIERKNSGDIESIYVNSIAKYIDELK